MILPVPCDQLGCQRCCFPKGARAGAAMADAELTRIHRAGHTVPIERRTVDGFELTYVTDVEVHGRQVCAALRADGCAIHEDKPTICRSYPAALNERGELTLSMTCTWVANVLFPEWSRRPGLTEQERAMFDGYHAWLVANAPDEIKRKWAQDAQHHQAMLVVRTSVVSPTGDVGAA